LLKIEEETFEMNENEKLVQKLIENDEHAWEIFDKKCSNIIDYRFISYQINDPELKNDVKQILINDYLKDNYKALRQIKFKDKIWCYVQTSIIRIIWRERNQSKKIIKIDDLPHEPTDRNKKDPASILSQKERLKIIEQFLLYLKSQKKENVMLYLILKFYFKKNNLMIAEILFFDKNKERQVRYLKDKSAILFLEFLKTKKIEYKDLF